MADFKPQYRIAAKGKFVTIFVTIRYSKQWVLSFHQTRCLLWHIYLQQLASVSNKGKRCWQGTLQPP